MIPALQYVHASLCEWAHGGPHTVTTPYMSIFAKLRKYVRNPLTGEELNVYYLRNVYT